jgi:hypothetical protein
MLAPPVEESWLSITIPLVPPNAAGVVTQLAVGLPDVQLVGVEMVVVVSVEDFTKPSLLPTPKNKRSVAPS